MSSKYVRLTQEFALQFNNDPRLWPKSREFNSFCKKFHPSAKPKTFPDLKAGKPITRATGEAFVACMRANRKFININMISVFEDAIEMPSLGVWKTGDTTLQAIGQSFIDRKNMYINNPVSDPELASRMILDTAGFKSAKPGDPTDEASCIERGEKIMLRTREHLTRQIREITRRDGLHRTVMFYLHKGQRIGVSFVLPVKQDRWEAIKSGQINDLELRIEDLDSNSRFLFIVMMSDAERIKIKASVKTLSQARCVIYQFAYFVRNIKPPMISLLTVYTSEYFRLVLYSQGLRETGNFLKGSTYPLVTLQHPKEMRSADPAANFGYRFHRMMIYICNFFNKKKWHKEDRSLGLR